MMIQKQTIEYNVVQYKQGGFFFGFKLDMLELVIEYVLELF